MLALIPLFTLNTHSFFLYLLIIIIIIIIIKRQFVRSSNMASVITRAPCTVLPEIEI